MDVLERQSGNRFSTTEYTEDTESEEELIPRSFPCIPYFPWLINVTARSNPQSMKELLYKEDTYQIRGACYEVYKEKGSGFVEPIYQECIEL